MALIADKSKLEGINPPGKGIVAMNDIQKSILYELTSRTEPIQRHFLLNSLHVQFGDLSDRAMRREVELMITIEKIPVGTCEDGYFLIRTRAELDRAMVYLDKKAASIAIRKNSLTQSFQEFGPGDKQMTLI